MPLIKHRFIEHKINPQTETLVIGTFNPDTRENVADFFYGRQRNFLWTLIPTSFRDNSLKGKSIQEKLDYIQTQKIDFVDLITEVNVEDVANYDDSYLDSNVVQWRNVIDEIKKLQNIQRVCFTRKTFSDIPNMKVRIDEIKVFCENANILFQCLKTPARYYRPDKQLEWSNFFNNGSR